MRLYYKTRESEIIKYIDLMCLYLYIWKYFKFSVGHPVIHVGYMCKDKVACLRMDGLIKCSIVPVLLFGCNNKLIFCLCRTYVLISFSEEYMHTEDEERSLTSTCVMDEVRLAVEKGYRFLEIYEIYEYQVTQYHHETGECGLFVDYINTFLKLKKEAIGNPDCVHSPEDEERYLESFRASEGIWLEKEAIRYNAAKRCLAKHCLNSKQWETDGEERSYFDQSNH